MRTHLLCSFVLAGLCLFAASCAEQPLCAHLESTVATTTKKVKDCAPSGTTYFNNSFDKAKCDASIGACSSADQDALRKTLDCADRLPACTPNNFSQFTTSLSTCGDLTGVSQACVSAYAAASTSKEETKP